MLACSSLCILCHYNLWAQVAPWPNPTYLTDWEFNMRYCKIAEMYCAIYCKDLLDQKYDASFSPKYKYKSYEI